MTDKTVSACKEGVKGLPEYSIEGGICNNPDCMGICSQVDKEKKYWICSKCAREKYITGFINAYKSLGGPV